MTTPTATGETTEEPLPTIAPVSPATAIKLTGGAYFDESNKLADITLAGKELTAKLAAAVTQIDMSWSAQQVGQLGLTIRDTPDAELLNSGLLARGTPLDFGDQHMTIRAVDFEGGSGGVILHVEAQSRIISTLKAQTGRGTWGEQDVSRWYADRAREAGAAGTIIQPDLGKQTITRQENDQLESTWDVAGRVATQAGVWCFEYENILVVGKPTWLAARQGNRVFEMHWNGFGDYTTGFAGAPRYTSSSDESTQESLTVDVLSADADKARPGMIFNLGGRLKPANGIWLITAVSPAVSQTKPVVLSCERPVDPVPPAAV